MPAVFEGLYLYEVVLLVLGGFLFVILIISLLYLLLHKRSMVSLLPFFVVAIAMIGYPSIKDIQYKDGLLTIEKTSDQLAQDPTNNSVRQNLQQQVANIASRPTSSSQSTATLAKAQFALGDEQAANANLQKALQADPKNATAQDLKQKVEAVDSLKQLTSQVEADPTNSAAKTKLTNTLAQASQLKLASPNALIQVAKAQAALGDHAKALENTQKVLSIDPHSAPALQLQTAIKERIAAPLKK